MQIDEGMIDTEAGQRRNQIEPKWEHHPTLLTHEDKAPHSSKCFHDPLSFPQQIVQEGTWMPQRELTSDRTGSSSLKA